MKIYKLLLILIIVIFLCNYIFKKIDEPYSSLRNILNQKKVTFLIKIKSREDPIEYIKEFNNGNDFVDINKIVNEVKTKKDWALDLNLTKKNKTELRNININNISFINKDGKIENLFLYGSDDIKKLVYQNRSEIDKCMIDKCQKYTYNKRDKCYIDKCLELESVTMTVPVKSIENIIK